MRATPSSRPSRTPSSQTKALRHSTGVPGTPVPASNLLPVPGAGLLSGPHLLGPAVAVILRLACFTEHVVLEAHPCRAGVQTSSVSKAGHCSIAWMDPVLFTRRWRLGWLLPFGDAE